MLGEVPFWQQVILNTIGPLTTVVLGALVVGSLANWIARKAQDRRDASQLRRDLLAHATEVATGLYFIYRQLRDEQSQGTDETELGDLRREFSRRWVDVRIRGEVLKGLVVAHFPESSPLKRHWEMVTNSLVFLHDVVLGTAKGSAMHKKYQNWRLVPDEDVKEDWIPEEELIDQVDNRFQISFGLFYRGLLDERLLTERNPGPVPRKW